MKYILDTNIFITPYRQYYQFQFGMQFWDFIVELVENKVVYIIDKVYNELTVSNDELSEWIKRFQKYIEKSDNELILKKYKEIINYVNSKSQYNTGAKDEFMREANADAWVIAHAYAKKLCVVTLESLNGNIKKKVPIPNICVDFKINYIGLFEFLKASKFVFCEE